jgi:hypothetical protein
MENAPPSSTNEIELAYLPNHLSESIVAST